MGQRQTSHRTITRAFDVMETLLELNGASVTSLARHLDLPKSTTHDYLQSLIETGNVVKENGEYVPSFKCLEMGNRLKHRHRLYQVSREEIKNVAAETGEVTYLVIGEGSNAVILHSVEGNHTLNLGTYPGMAMPLHTHAAGKVILAHRSFEAINKYISEQGLSQITEHTITDPERLLRELESIRENGYAVDKDQHVLGMGVVASPIRANNQLQGVVAIVCLSSQLLEDNLLSELIDEVGSAASTISINYKYGK